MYEANIRTAGNFERYFPSFLGTMVSHPCEINNSPKYVENAV